MNIGSSFIEQSDKGKLLGVVFDKNLNFNCHVEDIYKIIGQKLHALVRVDNFIDHENLQTVIHAFILSQFSSCPVIRMFHDRNVSSKINEILERALSICFRAIPLHFPHSVLYLSIFGIF